MNIRVFFIISLIMHVTVFYISTLHLHIFKQEEKDDSYIMIQEAPPPPPPLKINDYKTMVAKTETEPSSDSNKTMSRTNVQTNRNTTAASNENTGAEGGVEGGVPGGVAGGVLGASLTNYIPFYLVEELPQFLSPINPPYPEEARRLGIEGKVIMKIYIDDKGVVRDVEISKSPDEKLSEASKRAIYNAKFKPARLNGMARAVCMQYTLNFKLE